MNDVDDFIRANRDRFDTQSPPDALWQRIADRLPEPELTPARPLSEASTPIRPLHRQPTRSVFDAPRSMRRLLAASVTGLLLLAGLWAVNRNYGLTRHPEVVVASPGHATQFTQYARLIDTKRDELHRMTRANPALYRQFAGDLNKLEAGYQSLKADLPQNPNQEILIQAMIQNLQLQIDLLNQQLRVIRQMKQQTALHNENPA